MIRACRKCRLEIQNVALGNRIKIVGKEDAKAWILRHIRQFFSLVPRGFVKPEIESDMELCDKCYGKLIHWLNTIEAGSSDEPMLHLRRIHQ